MSKDRANAINSAAGVASQTPFTPSSAGNTSMVIIMNTKDREKARTAETNPLDKAVNSPLAKMLKPIKRSARTQIRFPVTASPYTGWSGLVNMDTSGFVAAKDATDVTMEITVIIFRLDETSFFSFP